MKGHHGSTTPEILWSGMRVQTCAGAMMNQQSKLGRVDDTRIRLTPKYEESYWTMRLGVSKSELEAAIKSVGPLTNDVVKKLRRES